MKTMFQAFRGVSNNRAYQIAFNDIFMRTAPETGCILGNSQRADFLPHLERITGTLQGPVQILDCGAGAGEIVDLALSSLREGTVNIEDPNTLLLDQYAQRLLNHPRLTLGRQFRVPIQSLYSSSLDVGPQDLILGIHMLYHLTPFRSRASVDPDQDIIDMCVFMFRHLALGGRIFLVYADQLQSTTGQAGAHYFAVIGENVVRGNLDRIWQARDRLLRQGEIQKPLVEQFGVGVKVETYVTHSYIFGNTIEELAIMCITGELGTSDEDMFEPEKLTIAAQFLNENQPLVGLEKEVRDISQRGMLRCRQPQVVTIITKGLLPIEWVNSRVLPS